MKFLISAFLIIGLFTATASKAEAAGLQCASVFSSESSYAQNKSLTPKQIVDSWFAVHSTTPISKKDSVLLRLRESLLLRRLDPVQLNQPEYARWWIEKMAELKVAERLSLLDNFKLSRRREQKNAQLLVLRSLTQSGLRSWLAGQALPGERKVTAKLKILARKIIHHPATRLILFWQVNEGRTVLNEKQIAAILEHGAGAFETDATLRKSLNYERDEARVRRMNQTIAKVALLAMTVHLEVQVMPPMVHAYDRGFEQARTESTTTFKQQVDLVTKVDESSLTLGLAKSQIETVIAEFKQQYHEAPTPTELAEIKDHICRGSMTGLLDQREQQQCMN